MLRAIVPSHFRIFPDIFCQVFLQGFAGRLEFYLVIDGNKVNTNDNYDKHQADPEHSSVQGKKCGPKKDDKRDQVKNDPRPDAWSLHSNEYATQEY